MPGTSVVNREDCTARPGEFVRHSSLGKVKLVRKVDDWLEVEIGHPESTVRIERVRPADCRQPTAAPKQRAPAYLEAVLHQERQIHVKLVCLGGGKVQLELVIRSPKAMGKRKLSDLDHMASSASKAGRIASELPPSEEAAAPTPEEAAGPTPAPQKKRGRPKGSKDKRPRKRARGAAGEISWNYTGRKAPAAPQQALIGSTIQHDHLGTGELVGADEDC